mgnify:CR=1 FL=1
MKYQRHHAASTRDLGELDRQSQTIKNVLAKVPGVADLSLEANIGKPQIKIQVNREALARYVRRSEELDRRVTWLQAAVPRGWLVLASLCLAPSLLFGQAEVSSLATSFFGMLLGYGALLFGTAPARAKRRLLSPEQFFYPLDAIEDWNRMYGRRGFTQYQCVLPESERPGATRRFLERMIAEGGSSFLSVLKDMGAEGEGMLSFPRPGVTVAVDLPIRRGTAGLVARFLVLVVFGRFGLFALVFLVAAGLRALPELRALPDLRFDLVFFAMGSSIRDRQ